MDVDQVDSTVKTEIILRAFWGAILLQGIIFLVPLVIFSSIKSSLLIKILTVAGSSILAFYMVAEVAMQKFGFKDGKLIYISHWHGLWPVYRSTPQANVNQILFGRLSKAADEASNLGWPLPEKSPRGINLVKQFFLVLTNDHRTIAVPTQSYSKKDGSKFINAVHAAGIQIRTI